MPASSLLDYIVYTLRSVILGSYRVADVVLQHLLPEELQIADVVLQQLLLEQLSFGMNKIADWRWLLSTAANTTTHDVGEMGISVGRNNSNNIKQRQCRLQIADCRLLVFVVVFVK